MKTSFFVAATPQAVQNSTQKQDSSSYFCSLTGMVMLAEALIPFELLYNTSERESFQ
jgi:hypothetical protein